MIKTQQLLLQREPIKTRPTRSKHSQGGAQRSEQYLYGAQRAIKSMRGRVTLLLQSAAASDCASNDVINPVLRHG